MFIPEPTLTLKSRFFLDRPLTRRSQVLQTVYHRESKKKPKQTNKLIALKRLTSKLYKCKELTIKKRGNCDLFSPIGLIPSCKEIEILGVTFRCDSKFSEHVRYKLVKANKSLHILRTLRKEGYNQSEIDLLFNTIVLPNINYKSSELSVYAASESDLTPVQCFLDRCFKRKYTSKRVFMIS